MKETYKYLGNAYTFYLYLCLCANADNYQFEFSPQQIEQQFGLPYNTVRDNIKRLIDKGFLVPIKEGSNIYDFYGELCACQPIIPQKKTTIPFKF